MEDLILNTLIALTKVYILYLFLTEIVTCIDVCTTIKKYTIPGTLLMMAYVVIIFILTITYIVHIL